jgi:hypothetical protein
MQNAADPNIFEKSSRSKPIGVAMNDFMRFEGLLHNAKL